MKISNSKKQLAKIIHENGGWRDGFVYAAQDRDGDVFTFDGKPEMGVSREVWMPRGATDRLCSCTTIRGWHQTILSRDEYSHLYPALGELCGKVTEENRHEPVWTNPPSIEQLAADYRNRKDYADRKQQEADAAKADAEVKLAELVAAGKVLGLVVSVAAVGPEPELVITDWRDLRVGDVVEYVDGDIKDKIGMTGPVVEFAKDDSDGMPVRLKCDNGRNNGRLGWPRKWRFIRRPAQGGDNA